MKRLALSFAVAYLICAAVGVVCDLWFRLATSTANAAAFVGPDVPAASTVRYVTPGTTASALSNILWTVPNNSEIHIAPGVYSVPLLGSDPAATACSLILPNKTNVSIFAHGAILSNSTPTSAGHMLMISNFNNVSIYGGKWDGGAIVDTNTGFPALIALDRTGDGFRLQYAHLTRSVKGVKAWTNSPAFTNLYYLDNRFTFLGDTNHPGVGGASFDGSAIEAWGNRVWAQRNTLEYCVKGFELYPQANETVFSQINITDNHFINCQGDFSIWFLSDSPITIAQANISRNTFSNAPNITILNTDTAGISIQGATLYQCVISENIFTGEVWEGINMVGAGSLVSSVISRNNIRTRLNGIRLESTTSGAIRNNVISENYIENVGRRGISLNGSDNVIANNFIRNVSTNSFWRDTQGEMGGIFIGTAGASSTNNYITGNVIGDDQATATTYVGIGFHATTAQNYVEGNNFFRVTTNVYTLSTTNRIAPRTVSEGTATLSSGVATVNTLWVGANSRIMLTPRATANLVNALTVTNVVNGTSFQIRSASNTDGNRVDWVLEEPQ